MALIKSKTADKDNWVVSQIDNAGCSVLTTNHFIKSTIHSSSHSIITSSVVDLNFVDGNKNLLHPLYQILMFHWLQSISKIDIHLDVLEVAAAGRDNFGTRVIGHVLLKSMTTHNSL